MAKFIKDDVMWLDMLISNVFSRVSGYFFLHSK